MLLESILSQDMIHRLGWTLLHFVWEATAVALLLAILLTAVRKATASTRYMMACAALGLIILLPLITMSLVPISQSQPITAVEPPPPAPAVVQMQPTRQEIPIAGIISEEEPVKLERTHTTPTIPWKQRATEKLEASHPYLVMGWLIGVFGLSLWHLGGWAQLHRLKKRMVKQVNPSLHAKLDELVQRLNVHRVVRLLESGLVQVPTVVGWLRPVILLPASALTGLTPEQLEALLAHELAHIRRCDYLINILQTLVETLGFYHPAVWWTSHNIRVERENCCDDLAVNLCGDRVRYARALASMEEIRSGRNEFAVAASGGNLFGRIRRLVGKDVADNHRVGWIPLVVILLLITVIAIPTTLALTENKTKPPSAELIVDKMLKHPTRDKNFQYFTDTNALPAGWSLKYIEDSDVGGNRAVLKAVPKPIDENDQSWKQERLEFRINSPEGKLADAITFGKRPPRHQVDVEPDKYILEYERRWGEPSDVFRIWREFPVDLSRPGIYELQFIPRLGTAEIAGALDGCYWMNFEKVDQGPEICGGTYQKAGKTYRLDGLPPGTYKLCAVTQRQSDNVFISPAEVTVSADEKAIVNITSPPRGNCSLKGRILGEQRKYQAPWQRAPESPGKWFVLIRRFGSRPIVKTKAYEAVIIDSLYVVRGCNIVQETKDQATYHIEGMVPGQYTVTAIEQPWWGCTITRQQSKTLVLKDGEDAVLDFDLRDIPKEDIPPAVETEKLIEDENSTESRQSQTPTDQEHKNQKTISGIVRDEKDRPMEGVKLNLIMDEISQDFISDDEGNYVIRYDPQQWGPRTFPHYIQARHERLNLAAITEIDQEVKTLDIKLKPGAVLSGKIVDPEGKGIAGATTAPIFIHQKPKTGGTVIRSQATSDSEGNFEIKAIPTGHTYWVTARADGYHEVSSFPIQTDGTATDMRFDVGIISLPDGTFYVTGIIVDANDQLVADAIVSIDGEGQKHQEKKTDAQGRFTFVKLVAGRIQIDAKTNGAIPRNGSANTYTGASDVKIVVTEQKTIETSQKAEDKEPNVDKKSGTNKLDADQDHIVKVDLSVVEVSYDSKINKETTVEIKNLLGDQLAIPDSPATADLLRITAMATAAAKDTSAGDKRVTQQKLNTLLDLLASRDYLKILMMPTMKVFNGKTAKIGSMEHIPGIEKPLEDSIQITPLVPDDDSIILQVEATLYQISPGRINKRIPIIHKSESSSQISFRPGESRIIGGMEQTRLQTEPGKAEKDLEKPDTELLIILTPTIVETAKQLDKKSQKQIEPNQVVFKLVDPNTQPIVGARVGTYVDWSDIAENPPVWFLRDGRTYRSVDIESDEHGKVILDAEDLFRPEWRSERKAPLIAIDAGHYLAGLRELSREDLGREITLTLQPGCRVCGRVSAATANKRKWSTKTLTVYVDWGELRFCQYTSKQGRFEFVLPPGIYQVKVYAEDPDNAVNLPIRIEPGHRYLDLTPYLEGHRQLPGIISNAEGNEDQLSVVGLYEDTRLSSNGARVYVVKNNPAFSSVIQRQVRVDCLVVEVSPPLKIDKEIENMLGDTSIFDDPRVRPFISSPDLLLKESMKTMYAVGKRNTQKQPMILLDALNSRGDVRVLMNPTLQLAEGQSVKIEVGVDEFLQVTPHINQDYVRMELSGHFRSTFIRDGGKQSPIIRKFTQDIQISTQSGEGLIIGMIKEDQETDNNTSNTREEATDLLYILCPSILDTTDEPQNETNVKERDDFSIFKPRLITLQNSDPVQTAELLTTLFGGEDENGVNIRDVIFGKDAEEKYNMTRPLCDHFTFEEVPGTHKIIVVSNIPKAYDVVVQWIVELDEQKMADKDIKEVREWMAGRGGGAQLKSPKNIDETKQSSHRLKELGLALAMYADEHEGTLPDTFLNIKPYVQDEVNLKRMLDNVEYLGKGKWTNQENAAQIPIAYDRTMLDEGVETNVLFLDFSVRLLDRKKLNELGIYPQAKRHAPSSSTSQFDQQVEESSERLKCISKALRLYANDHEGKYPECRNVHELREYLKDEEFAWLQQPGYLGGGRTITDRPDVVLYHDINLIKFGKGTNVLFNDGHVEFADPERLNDLNINKTSIQIDITILTGGDAFMKHINLYPNSSAYLEGWSGYRVHTAGDSTSFIIDPLHADLLIKTAMAHRDAKIITRPQILPADGKPATIQILDAHAYSLIPPDIEPNNPFEKTGSKPSIKLGTFIRIEPDALPDDKTVNLDFEWEYHWLRGFKKQYGTDQKTQKIPQIAVDKIATSCPIPEGKTLLIVGKRITELKKPSKAQLANLPLIGGFFHNPPQTVETRNLLILIKPIILPPREFRGPPTFKAAPPFAPNDPLIKKLEEKLRE
ncbi:MAG: carboxypeptidase regulatory-like domain-containing protein [Sedimentisphaerales bacterium]|nr:carboxypeptidase regulatory-like domain-containing protein [Sedimentisphaerales bacterium]